MTAGRAESAVLVAHAALAAGVGGLVVAVGGTLATALAAFAMMFGGLVAIGLGAAVFYGRREQRGRLGRDAIVALLSFYASTWPLSSAHSLVGDAAFVVLAGLPVWIGAVAGYRIGDGPPVDVAAPDAQDG